jgi:HSP20 family molecular chaperone IbpA
LTDNVDIEKITARAEDGILYLDLPIKKPVVKEDPAPLMIEVK